MEWREVMEAVSSGTLEAANAKMEAVCGVVDFFATQEEMESFRSASDDMRVQEERAAYGDWQTNETLARRVCDVYARSVGTPQVLIEPTCGEGNFILAALEAFPLIEEIYAIEINAAYVARLKRRLLERGISRGGYARPKIFVHKGNIFDSDLGHIKSAIQGRRMAIIGNPPWVTNSYQSSVNAKNVPPKRNVKNWKGMEAILGKSNFDISESICMKLLDMTNGETGGIAMLLKNSVIRNLLFQQGIRPYRIEQITQYEIDADSEFDISVGASCLVARFGSEGNVSCEVRDLYSDAFVKEYGWTRGKFVADIATYERCTRCDGRSPYIWRSGIKHDCAAIMELERNGTSYVNGLGETVDVEDDWIYPLLKSSDVHAGNIGSHKKYVIVTQKRVSQATDSLRETAPRLYDYLMRHVEHFNRRRSSIYRGKPQFCMFGVGDYSFMPYKIVVSGLYKDIVFRRIDPEGNKPVMIDDTCYQLGFSSHEEADGVYEQLIGEEIQTLIRSLVFRDAKRVVTRELLMRLAVAKIEKRGGEKATPAAATPEPGGRQWTLFG